MGLKLKYELLESLAVLADAGTFMSAADRSGLTQSAFSQRIRALELLQGSPLVIRSLPCKLTEAGHQLVQHYKQVAILEQNYLSQFERHENYLDIGITINAESYEYFLKNLPMEVWKKHRILLQIKILDEDKTLDSLRTGEVMGCISTSSKSPHGCLVIPFAKLNYHLVGAPNLVKNKSLDELLKSVPLIRYDRDDFLHKKILPDWEPFHSILLPSPLELIRATVGGMGLCVLPDVAIKKEMEKKVLVDLLPKRQESISLFWHYWEIGPPLLKELTKTLLTMAKDRK